MYTWTCKYCGSKCHCERPICPKCMTYASEDDRVEEDAYWVHKEASASPGINGEATKMEMTRCTL